MPKPKPWQPTVEQRPVDSLISYEKNARVHGELQVGQLAASIRAFGFVKPVLVDRESVIIAGHGRVLAALQLGLEQVPVIVCPPDLTEAQIKALRIADNQIAANSTWDADFLKLEITDLHSSGWDFHSLGFSADELTANLSLADIGTEPEPEQAESASDPGDEEADATKQSQVRFGSICVRTSEEEMAGLLSALDQYAEKFGSAYGFASALLSRAGAQTEPELTEEVPTDEAA